MAGERSSAPLVLVVVNDADVRALFATGLVHFGEATGSPLIAEGVEGDGEADAPRGLRVPLGQRCPLGRPEPVPA